MGFSKEPNINHHPLDVSDSEPRKSHCKLEWKFCRHGGRGWPGLQQARMTQKETPEDSNITDETKRQRDELVPGWMVHLGSLGLPPEKHKL